MRVWLLGDDDVMRRLVAVGDEVERAGERVDLGVGADPAAVAGEVDPADRGELVVELVGEGAGAEGEGPAAEGDDVGGDDVGRRWRAARGSGRCRGCGRRCRW